MMNELEMYVSPEIMVVRFKSEGILCISGEVDDSDDSEFGDDLF